MFWHSGQWYFYDVWRSNAHWNGVWYWADGGNTGKVLEDLTELPVGIDPPTTRLTVATETPPPDTDGLSGDITYVYTFYDEKTGAESPPSPESETIVAEAHALRLTGFEDAPYDYKIRIYRIGGIITSYSAVETIAGTGIVDYLDTKGFSEIEATLLDTLRSKKPPEGLRYIEEHQGRFWGASASRLYYTPMGKPDSWFTLDFIEFPENITMVSTAANGLLVSTIRETWVIVGNDPSNFAKYSLSSVEGCISQLSLAKLNGLAVWLSDNGFIMSDGAMFQNISTHKLGYLSKLDPRGAVMYNGIYIMSFGGSLVPSNMLVPGPLGGPNDDPTVGDLVPGTPGNELFTITEGAVIIDFSMGDPIFSTFEYYGLGDLGYYNNKLWAMATPETEEVNLLLEDGSARLATEGGFFNITADIKGMSTQLELFGSTDLSRIRYTSPLLTDGSIGMLKQYEKVRITYSGVIKVRIMDDKKNQMQEKELKSLQRTSEWIGIPVDNNRAYGIQIQIEGVGVIDSIMYTWTPWETQ
jgi:hypothetical protein